MEVYFRDPFLDEAVGSQAKLIKVDFIDYHCVGIPSLLYCRRRLGLDSLASCSCSLR